MAWWNPFKPKPTANIREQAPDRSRALQQLQESLSNQPDLFASLLDRYYSNDSWWFPVNGSFPAIGGTSNKMHGADRYAFYTEQDLRFQRDACRLLFAHEPVAKAIEGHMNAFVIGKGMSYKISPKKDFSEEYAADDGKKRLSKYQQAIDEWLDEQQWPEREQECYTCKMVDGEFFLWVTNKGGKIQVRRLEPEHIQNPLGKTYLDGWYLGVKIDLKDAETPLAYGYKPDGVAWQEIPAKQIIHFKSNVTRNVSRGISDFYPVTDDLKSISQLLDNIRDGAMARAEIAYMWSVKNATPAAIAGFADDKADRSRTNSITGKTNRFKGQQSGKAVAHGDNVEFTTMPQGDVEGSVNALQASLRMVGNRFCMPEYMVSADASNANYASTQMAGTPFVRKVEIEQNLLKRPFKQILMQVMQQAVVKGIIPTSEFVKLDIEIECGSPVIEDEYQQAQMYDIMRRNGVISPQKWCMAKGMDYEEVQRDLNEWNEMNMQAPDLGGAAGGTVFGAQQQDKQNEYDAQQNEPVQEAWNEKDHPRVGAGHSGGGEFTGKGKLPDEVTHALGTISASELGGPVHPKHVTAAYKTLQKHGLSIRHGHVDREKIKAMAGDSQDSAPVEDNKKSELEMHIQDYHDAVRDGDESMMAKAAMRIERMGGKVPDKGKGVGGGQFTGKRFEKGKALSPDDKKKVLKTVSDVYKDAGLLKSEIKGYNHDDEPIYGYPHSPDLFIKSDVTGAKVRHYLTLPDGTRAHPSELFPEITQAEIDKSMNEVKAEEKKKEADDKARVDRISKDKGEANQKYKATNRPMLHSYFSSNDKGEYVRVDGTDIDEQAFYLSKGYIKSSQAIVPTQTVKDAPGLNEETRKTRIRIEQLLKDGKHVSDEVMAFYPDLADKYKKG